MDLLHMWTQTGSALSKQEAQMTSSFAAPCVYGGELHRNENV